MPSHDLPLAHLALTLVAVSGGAQAGEQTANGVDPPPPIRIERIVVETLPEPVPPPPPIYMPPPPPQQIPAYYRGVSPRNRPETWITGDDYPSRDLREENEGTSHFILTVGEDGRVSDCQITITSGFPSLDEATCRNLMRRARFRPAVNGDGNPTVGRYRSRVRWTIPRPLPLTGQVVRTMLVDVTGEVSDCRVVRSQGEMAVESPVGPEDCYTSQFDTPFMDAKGVAVARRVTTTMTGQAVVPPQKRVRAASDIATDPYHDDELPLAGAIVRTMIVNADGMPVDCRIETVRGALAGAVRPGTVECPRKPFDTPFMTSKGEAVRRKFVETKAVEIAPVDGD